MATNSRKNSGVRPTGERRQNAHNIDAYSHLKEMGEGIAGTLDPFGMSHPILHAQAAWLLHPLELGQHLAQLSSDLWLLQQHTLKRVAGQANPDPVSPQADDSRFADPVWTESPTWDVVKEWYLALTHHMQDMLYDTPGLSSGERRRAAFWWRKWLNAVAPTNYLWLNPVALRKAVETHGESLWHGWRNMLDDVEAGNVRMTNPDDFKVGENLATTPGSVVHRNRLLEVIHYAPTQPRVHAEPLVIITPWINKFYVLDLVPKKSMVRFLLDQGFDVFITSWKNPDAGMRDVSFDDYLLEGIDTIVQVAKEISGAAQVHAAGYCIGGTALAIYMAWANRHYKEAMPVADWTLFTTLVDFRRPGDIEVFIDEHSIEYLIEQMAQKGYLDGREMAASFRLLRSNSLIWHYVVHGWLYGEAPSSFDVLFWNMDTTRMPYAMHAWYLRELYLKNRLIQGGSLTVAGEPIDLSAISQPLYAVAAEDDHIAPWMQAFRTMNLIPGERRFVLSSSGHILGIVNPPTRPAKRTYWAGPAHRKADTPSAWRETAHEHQGSWWADWMQWLKPRAGDLVPARPAHDERHPELAPAPGTYVLES